MPVSLTDQIISVTYKGVLHSQGAALPIANQVRIYDGDGNKTSFAIGRESAGMTVYGSVSASTLFSQNAVIAEKITSPSTAKAWVNFSGNSINGDQTINSGHNIVNVSRSGTGLSQIYTVNFKSQTNTTANYNYSITFASSKINTNYIAFAFADSDNPPTASYINLCFRKFNGSQIVPFDPSFASLTIFGN